MGLDFNFEELEYALARLSKKASNEMVDEALEAGAVSVLKAMNKYVPVDTTDLKSSLGEIKKEGSGANRKIHLGSKSKDRKIVERAYYQEYGNSSMMGKKWMKKSFDSSKKEAITVITDNIVDNLLR